MIISLLHTRPVRVTLTLMAFALSLAMSSAALSSEPSVHSSQDRSLQKRRIVARGRLTGGREVHHIVTWQTGINSDLITHLAIQTTGPHPRNLWQADEHLAAIDINAVRIANLDGEGLPEIMGLWWRGASIGATLRIFRWNRASRTFAELRVKDGDPGLAGIHGYRLSGHEGHQRITVFTRSTATGWPPIADGEFEVRGAEIVRARGRGPVTTPTESGIEGQAVISPAHPGPVRAGQSDSAPYRTTLVVWRVSDGSEVTRFETGSDGRFRVGLPPGTYRVGPPQQPGRFLPRAGEETITVAPGKFAHVAISFDSGMR